MLLKIVYLLVRRVLGLAVLAFFQTVDGATVTPSFVSSPSPDGRHIRVINGLGAAGLAAEPETAGQGQP